MSETRLALLLGLMLALAGCSSAEPLALSEEELLSGAYTFERPEVGSIAGCTATLVGPRLVLTASHCVGYETRTTPGNYGRFYVWGAPDRVHRYVIEQYVSYGDGVGDDDVALLRLAEPVPEEIATPAGLASAEPEAGTPVTIYGYGCQARGANGPWAKQSASTTWGIQTANLCPGDSGGPTMTDDGLVVRVNSGYYLDAVGADVFGVVPVVFPEIEEQVAAWGDELGTGTPIDAVPLGAASADGSAATAP